MAAIFAFLCKHNISDDPDHIQIKIPEQDIYS